MSRPPIRSVIRVLATVGLTSLALSGCAAQHPAATEAPPLDPPAAVSIAYDPTLQPAAAVLSIVPQTADRLAVDDYTEIKLDLGLGQVTSASPAAQRAQLATAMAQRAVTFGDGLLAPVDATLRQRYGFGQDDVAWQALFTGPGVSGWAIKLDDDVAETGPLAAVAAHVGPLAAATYYPSSHIFLDGGTLDPATSWRATASLRALTGQVAQSTYAQRSCIPFATAFGSGVQDQLAPADQADLAALTPLSAFSVSYGTTVVTARLGSARDDVFDRARLAGNFPPTRPDFGLGYSDPLADPEDGQIGYTLGAPRVAAQLALDERLPFAVCDDQSGQTASETATPSTSGSAAP